MMRFFIKETLHESKHVTLEGKEFLHLAKVLRKKPGETVELINGKNCLAEARIESIQPKKAMLHITSMQTIPPIKPEVFLVNAFPKLTKLQWVLEKATELGVNHFVLFPGEQSEKTTISTSQLERFSDILIAAIKQCGRVDLPSISVFSSLESVSLPENTVKIFGDPSHKTPLKEVIHRKSPIAVFIGPEKGWSEKEKSYLVEKATAVSLNPNVLRTETASITAIALIRQ